MQLLDCCGYKAFSHWKPLPCSSPFSSYCDSENFPKSNGICKLQRMYILSNVCIWCKGVPMALKV